jgi:hypothetical protein
MLNDIVIIDDAIPVAQQIELETLFTGPTIPWSLVPPGEEHNSISLSTKDSVDYTQFVHLVFWDEHSIVSPSFPLMVPILSAMPINIKQLLRIKANVTLSNKNRPLDSYGMPHVDFTPPVKGLVTAIYYINDSDGDTVMFNQVGDKLLPIQTITPKRGRLVMFNGARYHSGNCPTNDKPRALLNINFLPVKEYNGIT